MQILKIHAYETDFRQRVRAGDGFEFFFDVKDEDGHRGQPRRAAGHRHHAGGETHRYYRFRTPDGGVDYYDSRATPRASS